MLLLKGKPVLPRDFDGMFQKKDEKNNKKIILFYFKKYTIRLNGNVCPLLVMSRRGLKRYPGWEANVTHGVSQESQVPDNYILKLFPSYPTWKVETGLIPPEMLCLKDVPG